MTLKTTKDPFTTVVPTLILLNFVAFLKMHFLYIKFRFGVVAQCNGDHLLDISRSIKFPQQTEQRKQIWDLSDTR